MSIESIVPQQFSGIYQEITPEIAKSLLSKLHYKQRSELKRQTIKLASRIKAGKWDEQAGFIVIDSEGFLVDGQHRLRAVVHSGITIKAIVMRGEWSQYRDDGARRTVAQRVGCPKNQAAVTSFIARMLSIKDGDEAYEKFGKLVVDSECVTSTGGKKPWGTAAVAAGVACCHALGKDAKPLLLRLRHIEPVNRREKSLIKKTTMARSVWDLTTTAEIVSAVIGKDIDMDYVRGVFIDYMKAH